MKTTLPVRHSDPDTSHDAAVIAVTRRPAVRDAVLTVIRVVGPVTQDQLIAAYRAQGAMSASWPWATDSSIRTRCSELVRDGLVERVPDAAGTSNNGNRAAVWRVVA